MNQASWWESAPTTDSHAWRHRCKQPWCRIHFWPTWTIHGPVHDKYPIDVFYRIGVGEMTRYNRTEVYCGPGAYLPKRDTARAYR